MNIRQSSLKNNAGNQGIKVLPLRNDLKIDRIEYFRDPSSSQMILLMESGKEFPKAVKVFLRKSSLFIEAGQEHGHAVQTHILHQGHPFESLVERNPVQFSEIQLNMDYAFALVSRELVGRSLLKVILNYRKESKNNVHYN